MAPSMTVVIDPELRKAEDGGWHELHALVDSLPADAVEQPGYFEEGWSAKDLVAHIGAWLAQAGVALEQIGSGTYRPDEIDIDALNGRYLEALQTLPFDVIKAQADASRTRMLIASAGVREVNEDAAFWIRKAGPDHYAEHLPRLREWVKEVADALRHTGWAGPRTGGRRPLRRRGPPRRSSWPATSGRPASGRSRRPGACTTSPSSRPTSSRRSASTRSCSSSR